MKIPNWYLIEYFDSPCPSYEEYLGNTVDDAIQDFRKDHPNAILQNVFLNINYEEKENA